MRVALSSLLKDAAIVAIVGAAIGALANAVSPRGLSLTRDYFAPPALPSGSAVPALGGNTTASLAPGRANAAAKHTPRGFALVGHDEVLRLHRDPRRAEGRILFIDARNDGAYQAAHLPGARQFDHYRMDRHIAEILPLALAAEQIVIYCNGGECEDSDLVAGDLASLGIPREKLMVYEGGITAWRNQGLPLEPNRRPPGKSGP